MSEYYLHGHTFSWVAFHKDLGFLMDPSQIPLPLLIKSFADKTSGVSLRRCGLSNFMACIIFGKVSYL